MTPVNAVAGAGYDSYHPSITSLLHLVSHPKTTKHPSGCAVKVAMKMAKRCASAASPEQVAGLLAVAADLSTTC